MATEAKVLLRVRHGSHLYGTAHADSDEDWYEVVEALGTKHAYTSRYGHSKQTLRGPLDVVQKDLGTWLREVQAGVPQACEAAWADPALCEVDKLPELRLRLRVGTAGIPRHRRALRNFATAYWDGGHPGDEARLEYAMKRARHAVRLAISINKLREFGWYNPTLTEEEVAMVKNVARNLGPGTELLDTCDWIAFEL